MESAVFEGLNDEQKAAVGCVEGPVLIVAGAGSGKTRVLTSRVAYLMERGADPAAILALTFTKKAAEEMKERIGMMVGERRARRLVMGTFHSVFVRFLRSYAGFLGYPEQFTIYDTSDSTSAVKACIKEFELDDKIYKPRDVLSRISMAKNNLVTVKGYRASRQLQDDDFRSKKPRIVDIYELYQQKLKQAGAMDFDDILLNMNILLRDNPEALRSISERFSYILVDEYQDTNQAQYIIIKKLAAVHRNLCVVGDDSQSIYAFRGARVENILNFKKDFPECRTFRLERNYRSTSTIVNAANSLISKNENRIPKECYSVGGKGELIKILETYSEQDEAMNVVSEILDRMRSSGAQYQDFAILYRTNSQSRALEEQLRRRNIPYMVYSGNSFFERAEVKDMMAYFKLAVNPMDNEAFKRVVNKPARAIGDTTVAALEKAASVSGRSLYRAVFLEDLETYGIRNAAILKLREFCNMVDRWAVCVKTTDAFELARRIADDSGLYAFYKADTSVEGLSRTANVEELVNSVQSHVEDRNEEAEEETLVTLDDFLENVALLSNVDVKDDEDTNNKVALMTAHSAKGLEFPYVFITGLEENLFPSSSMLARTVDIEEERRLCYVAVTRAKRALYLSFAATRMRNGKHESNPPSRFIKEIDAAYYANPLDDSAFDNAGLTHEWGGFGSRFTGGRMDRFGHGGSDGERGGSRGYGAGYGSSARGGKVTFIKRETAPRPVPAAPVRPAAAKPDVIDPDFVAVPMTELREGQRIEHNRFGAGLIKSISGTVPELKAVIVFDDYGEKLMLLKYAKLRFEKK